MTWRSDEIAGEGRKCPEHEKGMDREKEEMMISQPFPVHETVLPWQSQAKMKKLLVKKMSREWKSLSGTCGSCLIL